MPKQLVIEFGRVRTCFYERLYGFLSTKGGKSLFFHSDNACEVVMGETGVELRKCRQLAPRRRDEIVFIRGIDHRGRPCAILWAYAHGYRAMANKLQPKAA